MYSLPNGDIVLVHQDIIGIQALINAHAQYVVDIHALTSEHVNLFVARWEALTESAAVGE